METAKLFNGKKGALGLLGSLPGIFMIIFLAVLIAVIIVYALAEFQSQLTANTTAWTIANDSIDAFTNFPTWLGLVITMIMLAIVVSVIYLYQRAQR